MADDQEETLKDTAADRVAYPVAKASLVMKLINHFSSKAAERPTKRPRLLYAIYSKRPGCLGGRPVALQTFSIGDQDKRPAVYAASDQTKPASDQT